MKQLKRILSLSLAVIMIFSLAVPALAAEGDETVEPLIGSYEGITITADKPEKTNLVIHKLVAESYKNGVPFDHNGGVLTKEDYDSIGTNVKALADVTFTYYSVSEDEFIEMNENPANYQTKEAVEAKVGEAAGTVTTGEDGSVSLALAEGYYWFIETDRPSSVTDSKAVPFGISLPITNQVEASGFAPGQGYLNEVHVYPKNVSQKPQMDKGFKNLGDDKKVDSQALKEWQDTYGPVVDQYTREKAAIDARVGSKVPYQVETVLKNGQQYKNLYWSDFMTAGLKYNKDDSVSISYNGVSITDFTIDENDYGFELSITSEKNKATIDAINAALKEGDVTIVLEYSATVTSDSVVDKPETNSITFSPTEPNPKNDYDPVAPTNGNISVTKTWAEGETVPTDVLVTYILMETKNKVEKPVASITIKNGEIISKSFKDGVGYDYTSGYDVTFTKLDENATYKVLEFADGYKPEYTSATGVKNTAEPDRITPTPPSVVTGGKKFVKTDNSENKTRLMGAEFVIKNANGDYLAYKAAGQADDEAAAVKEAKDALSAAIDQYNNMSKADQDGQAGIDKKKEIASLQADYNEKVKKAGTNYQWVENKEDALTLVSDEEGKFEITGLAYGTYELEETKQPAGFAKLKENIKFVVSSTSYENGVTGEEGAEAINYEIEGTETDALRVINKKITIPQTGGIGTAIFAIVGVGLMAGALVAMKKRNHSEEA